MVLENFVLHYLQAQIWPQTFVEELLPFQRDFGLQNIKDEDDKERERERERDKEREREKERRDRKSQLLDKFIAHEPFSDGIEIIGDHLIWLENNHM